MRNIRRMDFNLTTKIKKKHRNEAYGETTENDY
jgi:hypothetical protein